MAGVFGCWSFCLFNVRHHASYSTKTMRTLRSYLALVASLLVVACAAANYGDRRTDGCGGYIDEQRLRSELSSSTECCTDLRSIKGAAATFDGEALYGLLKTSPTFAFPAGKSRFAAFQLEPITTRKFLVVQQAPSGMTTMAESCGDHKFSALIGNGSARYRAIEPLVTFLDSNGTVLASGVPQVEAFRVPIPRERQLQSFTQHPPGMAWTPALR
jgi:hypothetical protein